MIADSIKSTASSYIMIFSSRFFNFTLKSSECKPKIEAEFERKSNYALFQFRFSKIETRDRLSNLSDCVILHILSFLNANDAVRTCVLSSRWKNLWKLLSELTLHPTDFQTCKNFTKFVYKVISLRDPSIPLQAIDFKYDRDTLLFEPSTLKMVVNYAISHDIRRLGLSLYRNLKEIPDSIFSCQTLTHLKLTIDPRQSHPIRFPESSNLPALTILQLENLEFCACRDNARAAEPFSTLNRLNSLLIFNCTLDGAETLCISSATLVNLTLYHRLVSDLYTIELCTPSLCTFAFTGTPYQELSGRVVSSLKHVEIYEKVNPDQENPLFLFNWLREFPKIKSLTVSATTLETLYLIPNLSKINLPSSLGKLESLRVIMEPSPPHIPDRIMDYLLQNSPTAKVDFIDCSRQPRRPTHL